MIYCNLVLSKTIYYISKYYGITQNPTSKNFMIIMNYYKSGDLTRCIASDFLKLSWNSKLNTLRSIISGLREIHSANIIHKDYHSGNIFIDNILVITGDLGISKSTI